MEWDVRSFANETAQVWLKELLRSITGDTVRQTIEVVDLSEKFVDSQDAERAVAAAEIVAASRGFPAPDLPDEARLWINAQHYRAPDSLVDTTVQVADKVLKRSELRDLWEGTDAASKWRLLILDLIDRLEEAAKIRQLEEESHLAGQSAGTTPAGDLLKSSSPPATTLGAAASDNGVESGRSEGTTGGSISAPGHSPSAPETHSSSASKALNPAVAAQVELLFGEAVQQVSSGSHDKAVGVYNRLIEVEPNYVLGYIGRGTSFLALGMFEEALADFNRAIDLDPDLPEIYYLRAQAFFQTENIGRTIADLTILIRLQPDRADAYMMRGLANSEMDRYEKAIDDFSKAIELDGELANAYLHRGRAYERLQRFDMAGKDQKQYERLTGTVRKL